MDTDVLGNRVHVAKSTFKRATRVKRTRSGPNVDEINGLYCAGNGMRCSQSHVRSRLHRGVARRCHDVPEPIQAVEQKQPCRAHQRLRLGYSNLGSMIVAEHLCRPLRCFCTGNLVESLYRGTCNSQSHRTETGYDPGERRNTIAWLGQDVRISKARAIGGRYKHVAHHHIVAAGSAKTANGPRVDDL